MAHLTNVHLACTTVPKGSQDCAVVTAGYTYYHYIVDGFDDTGWGCAYRWSWVPSMLYRWCA